MWSIYCVALYECVVPYGYIILYESVVMIWDDIKPQDPQDS